MSDKPKGLDELHEMLDEAATTPEFATAFAKAFALKADTVIVIALNSKSNEIMFNTTGTPVDVRDALRGCLNTFLESHPDLKDN